MLFVLLLFNVLSTFKVLFGEERVVLSLLASSLLSSFFLRLNIRRAIAMSSTMNMIAFTRVHWSTNAIGRLVFSVSRNTMIPAMPRMKLRIHSVWCCFCFFVFSSSVGLSSLCSALFWFLGAVGSSCSFFCFCFFFNSTQMSTIIANMRPTTLSIRFTRAQVCKV